MNDFLNPKSMTTPGACAGIVMLITNALANQFSLPTAWTGIVLSFLLGFIVFAAENITRLEKSIYYVVNSLIIFATAFGMTTVGAGKLNIAQLTNIFSPSTVYAQNNSNDIVIEKLKILRIRSRGSLVIEEGGRNFLSNFVEIEDRGILKDIKVTVDLIHPNYDQLQVELTTPQRKVVMLHDHQVFPTSNMVAIYTPDSLDSLNEIIDSPIDGKWDIRIYDNSNTIRATLNYWQLDLTYKSLPKKEKNFFQQWSFDD